MNPLVLFSSDGTALFTGSYLTYGNVEEGRVEQEVQAPCPECV